MFKMNSLIISIFILVIGLSFISCISPSQMDASVLIMYNEGFQAIHNILGLDKNTQGISKRVEGETEETTANNYVYNLQNIKHTVNGSFIKNKDNSRISFSFSPKLPSGCSSISAELKKPKPGDKMIVTINGKRYYVTPANEIR